MSREYYLKNKERILERNRQYRLENPEKIKDQKKRDIEKNGIKRREKQKEWRESNAERHKEQKRQYFQNNKELIYERRSVQSWRLTRQSQYNAEYLAANKDSLRIKRKEAFKNSPHRQMAHRLFGRVRSIIWQKRNRPTVSDKYADYIGCTRSFFIAHVESLFKEGMTWDNYGKGGWEIDHKIPCSVFDLTKEDEQLKCFHYTNLQPLWWRENISKGKKIIKQL